ncbi:Unknown protein sequence [Pseudomonas syringae pv. cilantro]|uniref:Uncharacterized protein n=1 Tax=Pseudomonas syringae pv. cilantro TaxID=81035 RepID=A0A0N1JPF9_PSESX|nr:Unknown protein sequence [Pseudomonas syringae pv. cilantro]
MPISGQMLEDSPDNSASGYRLIYGQGFARFGLVIQYAGAH